MSRARISPEVQARVLAESRRRCAVCYGLNNDASKKKGQIAHLDQDAANNSESNLIFLCFDHHDDYDSTTRQAKGLTQLELLEYRSQLIAELERRWASGDLDASPSQSPISIVLNVSASGGAGGAGGMFGGGGGGGGAPLGGGGAGGQGFSTTETPSDQ
jgi:uncharacterized membrane protein YgcG